MKKEVSVVRILSNDENATFQMQQELQGSNVRFLIGDVRDKERLRMAMKEIDVVYHAAALKHVPLCEYNPFEAIKTNVLGTQNVIDAALEENVGKVINISTDKAVNPVNTMGTTKLLSERLVIDANFYKGRKKTVFSCVRFGNVSFSRGSVIPLFKKQIMNGGPVTLTDKNMTRFIMSISKAVELVFKATEMTKGGEVFIFKMPVIHLGDLAEVMVKELSLKHGYKPERIKIKIIGPRPGEKLHEELMTDVESRNALETKEMFILLPQVQIEGEIGKFMYPGAKKIHSKTYNSNEVHPLSKNEIRRLLNE
ncbi:MAG: polysaccharide biosynthesis protein [Thermoplasmatales archaeon]|nr:polysaccharide biosynthesis protein [Thermoplasmatales archaeon]